MSNADQKTSDVGLNIDGFARATHHRSDSHEHSEAPSSAFCVFSRPRVRFAAHPVRRPRSVGHRYRQLSDGAHDRAPLAGREGAMAARRRRGRRRAAVASDLMERRRPSGGASRPSEDRRLLAWFETAPLDPRRPMPRYCAAPGMPSAVLWSAWRPSGRLRHPTISRSQTWRVPTRTIRRRAAVAGSNPPRSRRARSGRAYRAQVNRWDSTAETAQTEEEHDAAVLAALLRERGERGSKAKPALGREFGGAGRRLGRSRPLCSGCLAS